MNSLVNIICTLFAHLFDMYVVYRFMTIFFDKPNSAKPIVLSAYFARLVLSIICNVVFPYPFVNITVFIGTAFCIALCYPGKPLKKLLVSLLIIICNIASEIIVASILNITSIDIFSKGKYGDIFVYLLVNVFFWLTTLIFKRFTNIKMNSTLPRIFFLAILVIPLSSLLLEMLFFQQKTISKPMTLLSLVCVLTSVLVSVYLYDSLARFFYERTQMELLKREQNYYHQQSLLLQKNHKEVQVFRHDMKNQIVAIQRMAEENEISKLLDYTEQMTRRLSVVNCFCESDNIAIDSIINYKLTFAKNSGIRVKTKISIPKSFPVKDDDMVIILGNLLDNALDGARTANDNKYISLTLVYQEDHLSLQISNSHNTAIKISKGKYLTHKKESALHGIGLESVRSIVNKYSGIMEVTHTEHEFLVRLMLLFTD